MCSGTLFLITTAIALASANAVSTPPSPDDVSGKLHLFTMTAEKMDGVYYKKEGGGIRFISERDSIYIGTMEGEGEPLLIGEKPAGSARTIQILQTNLLEVKEGADAYEEFIVPESMAATMKVALKSSNPRKFKSALRNIRRLELNVDAIKQNAINEMLERPEIQLMQDAALKLMDLGIAGDQYPSALTFLVTVKRFITLKLNASEIPESDTGSGSGSEPSHPREKRACSNWWSRNCPSNRCPIGSQCLGMCGPRCWWCWPICPHLRTTGTSLAAASRYGLRGLAIAYALNHIWNDCCYHQGCYEHDVCCDRYGFGSTQCLIPYGFSCSGYSC